VSNVEVVGAQVDLPKVNEVATAGNSLEPMKPAERNLGSDLSVVQDISVRVSVVLGTTDLPVRQLLKLGRGAVVELNRRVGDPVDVYINDRLVARGEMIRLGDKLGVTMTEICKSD
jgi:flagellar motor switch protein FliN/FliY